MPGESQRKVRFAFIGCGAIAQKHVTALSQVSSAEVVGVFDVDPGAAFRFGQKYQVPAFTTVDDLVAKTDPDFLNILTPSGCHAQNQCLDLILALASDRARACTTKLFGSTMHQRSLSRCAITRRCQ